MNKPQRCNRTDVCLRHLQREHPLPTLLEVLVVVILVMVENLLLLLRLYWEIASYMQTCKVLILNLQ